MTEPKGYPEQYSWVGFMPDGTKMRFATEDEYVREFWDELKAMGGS